MLFVVACSKSDPDVTAPSIVDYTMDNKTEDIEVAASGSTSLYYNVTDDQALSEIRLDVHDAFDGHTHGKTASFTKMSWEQIDDLSGSVEATNTIQVDVPSDAMAGAYHMEAIVVDAAGNQTPVTILDFIVTNSGQAVIDVTSHDLENDEVHIHGGDTVRIQGTITDDVDLDEIIIAVLEEHEHGKVGKTAEGELYLSDYDLGGSNDVSFTIDEEIYLPAGETGHFELEIVAIDSDGNMTIVEGEIHAD